MVHWRLSAHKYWPPMVGFTQTGIHCQFPPPWSFVESETRTKWNLVYQEVERKQWRLRKPKLTFDEQWQIICADVERYEWNTRACALWHLLKIEFLLSDV